jgi:flagellar basal-body rod modification protein FlgD
MSTDTTSAVSSTTATSSQVARTDTGGSLGQDAFLKLLVAQMQNQDPMQPEDSGQMMSQLASFSQVSQLQSLTSASQAQALGQDFSTAVALIGKSVTYTKSDGSQASGAVTAVKSDPSGALLEIGTDEVHTGAIVKVQ